MLHVVMISPISGLVVDSDSQIAVTVIKHIIYLSQINYVTDRFLAHIQSFFVQFLVACDQHPFSINIRMKLQHHE